MRSRNVTFSVLAQDVEAALENHRDAEQEVKDAEQALSRAKAHLANTREKLHEARDALFEHHPELRPHLGEPQITNYPTEHVEVDSDEPPNFEFRETPA